jgi:hypothetical protein
MVGELILSAYFTIGPLEHCPNWGKTTQVKGHGTAGMAGVSANDSPILRPQPPKIAASSLAIVLDVADIRRLLLVSWVPYFTYLRYHVNTLVHQLCKALQATYHIIEEEHEYFFKVDRKRSS